MIKMSKPTRIAHSTDIMASNLLRFRTVDGLPRYPLPDLGNAKDLRATPEENFASLPSPPGFMGLRLLTGVVGISVPPDVNFVELKFGWAISVLFTEYQLAYY